MILISAKLLYWLRQKTADELSIMRMVGILAGDGVWTGPSSDMGLGVYGIVSCTSLSGTRGQEEARGVIQGASAEEF